MEITTFGIFWTFVLIIVSFRGRGAIFKCLLFSALFQAGAFFIIAGSKAITPLFINAVVYIVYCLLIEKKTKPKMPQFFGWLFIFLATILITSVLASVLFGGLEYMECTDWEQYSRYDGHVSVWGIIVLSVYSVCGLFIYNCEKIDVDDIDKLMSAMVMFVFVVGLWSEFSVMQYIPRNDFIANFIYSNSTTTENIAYFVDIDPTQRIYSSILGIRFYSSFMEPSYCAGFLGMSFAYFISKTKLNKRDVFLVVLILLMTVMTFSATAYLSVAVAGILSAILSNKLQSVLKIAKRGSVLIIIGFLAVTYLELWDTIDRLIVNKFDTHSAYIRGLWNTNAIQTFFDTYGVGMGYANVRGSSLLYTLPASLGVFGTIFFVIFIIACLCTKPIDVSNTEGRVLTFKLMWISVIVAMCVAISVMDYSVFWIGFWLCIVKKTTQSLAE